MTPRDSDASRLNKRIGEEVRQRRVALQISVSSLARMIGIPPERLKRHEQGIEPFEVTSLYAAARALDARLQDLLGAAEPPSRRAEAGADDPPADARLMHAFALIDNDRVRTAVVEWIEAIASSMTVVEDQRPRKPATRPRSK